jgi:hypothetical protein
MGVFGHLFGHGNNNDTSGMLAAIERAVSGVEPLLKQIGGYPNIYRKPVAIALEYAHSLAANLPGPVLVNRQSYANDTFVHSLFPALDSIIEALCSSAALQEYQRNLPGSDEMYALMGMRRYEKTVVGMELSGETIQRDVVQHAIYFTSHTIENPAPSEQQAREQVAWSFFDSLVNKVKKRVEQRRLLKQSLLQARDSLMVRLRTANAQTRPALEDELTKIMRNMQLTISSLELDNYLEDFNAVLMQPEHHLCLVQTAMILDRMGIRRNSGDTNTSSTILFHDLIGFDHRDWTVIMVQCNNLQSESFATRLEQTYRKLSN